MGNSVLEKVLTTDIEMKQYIADFPILARKIHGNRMVYLDSAATTQKPSVVIEALSSFYKTSNANIHRGVHTLSEEASNHYDGLRMQIAEFIGNVDSKGIVFTRNTTESINLVARSWGNKNIQPGDEILISMMEHHSNFLPWMMLAREKNAVLKFIDITNDGYLDMDSFRDNLTTHTKIVALTHVSNVLGTINNCAEIIDAAHKKGAKVLIDGAQGVPHKSVNVVELNADFFAFSPHKMLGPTGLGVLYVKPELLEEMDPYQVGGGMITSVTLNDITWANIPHRFEAGTPNFGAATGFSAALNYLRDVGLENILKHEQELARYTIKQLKSFKTLKILGNLKDEDRAGVITFHDDNLHPHDLAMILDTLGIAIRAGHHCAQPLLERFCIKSSARVSFYLYNTKDDVDAFIDGLKYTYNYLGIGR